MGADAEQALLQTRADALVDRLGLVPLLSQIGRPVRVGSSALGLMVRRDIDITVIAPRLDGSTLAALAGIGARLMAEDEMVGGVRFRNDAGPWNAAPADYPDGLYLGLTVRDDAGQDWSFDIWVVDDPGRQPDLKHLETMPPKLTDAVRSRILAIKRHLVATPRSTPLPSAWVYEAVLDRGVVDPEGFERWLAQQKPGL